MLESSAELAMTSLGMTLIKSLRTCQHPGVKGCKEVDSYIELKFYH